MNNISDGNTEMFTPFTKIDQGGTDLRQGMLERGASDETRAGSWRTLHFDEGEMHPKWIPGTASVLDGNAPFGARPGCFTSCLAAQGADARQDRGVAVMQGHIERVRGQIGGVGRG